jgi:hypothetical protein
MYWFAAEFPETGLACTTAVVVVNAKEATARMIAVEAFRMTIHYTRHPASA